MSGSEKDPAPTRALRWLAEATDASLLAIPRLFGLVYGHIEDRLSFSDAWRAAMNRRIPAHVGWKHAFGGATYFLFMVLVVTGVMLSFYYRPSAVEAYPSLQYLETEVRLGWLVRHVHFWAASLVVVTVLIHLFRVLFSGTYRAPRETTWLMGIFLLLTLLAFVTSGYLLPYDQWAYWTTTDGIGHLENIPLVGGLVAQLFRADEFVSGATLSRFYAVHVILLPWVALLLLSLHFQLVRKHGVAPEALSDAEEGIPFFPHHMLRQLVVAFIVLGLVVTLAAFWPRPFSGPADPFSVPSTLPPQGIPATILVGAGRLPGGLGLLGLPVLLFLLAILPLMDRTKGEGVAKRPLAVVVSLLFLLLLLVSWGAGIASGSGLEGGMQLMLTRVLGTLAILSVLPCQLGAQETMAGFIEEDYSCVMCHTEMRNDFLEGVHSSRGIQCTDCHGGDPAEFEADASHSGEFRGAFSKVEGVDLCLSCHGDIAEMRQYALEPVTRSEFLLSRHGQRLLEEGDTLAPSCSDCHGAHAILPRVDPRSRVNPARVSEMCAGCHTDPRRFPETMSTAQYGDWAASAHGVALIEQHNDRSANCASCHGSHSAMAPGVREIPNVCGKCHQLVREAYFQGAHREQIAASALEAGCTGCHENHGTEMPPFSEIAGLCQGCHEQDSPQAIAGLELQQQILRAEAAGERAREGVRTLAEAGERTEDEEVRLQTMETHLREIMVLAHTLDPVVVEDLSRRVSSLAGEIAERAESVEEHRWERKILAIPFWILALGGVLLALRKRRALLRGRSETGAEEVGEGS